VNPTCLINFNSLKVFFSSVCSCGSVAEDTDCYLFEDKSKSYPDCCPKLVCPESLKNEHLAEEGFEGPQQQIGGDYEDEQDEDDQNALFSQSGFYDYSSNYANPEELQSLSFEDEKVNADADPSWSNDKNYRKISPRFNYLDFSPLFNNMYQWY